MKLLIILTIIAATRAEEDHVSELDEPKIVPRIVNGAKAEFEQFPHHATLLKRQSFRGGFRYGSFCGATIISDRWLVTAGHCSLGVFTKSNIKVVVGAHRLDHEDRIIADVEQFIVHPRFSMNPVSSDIALIKVKDPLPTIAAIKPAKLPYSGQVFTGSGITSGHGTTDLRFPKPSDDLFWLDIKLESDTVCERNRRYQWPSPTIYNREFMLCASAAPTKSPCMGDSGGPLIQKDGNGEVTLLGVVSFGSRICGEQGMPFVYTKVAYFRDWIEKVTGL